MNLEAWDRLRESELRQIAKWRQRDDEVGRIMAEMFEACAATTRWQMERRRA